MKQVRKEKVKNTKR